MSDAPESLLESIRKRPGMFIGGTGRDGLHYMLYRVFDDICDNARAGRGGALKVHFRKDDSCEIFDDGAPLPPFSPDDGAPLLRIDEMTSSFAGLPDPGVAPPEQVRGYLSLLRALSTRMEVAAYVGGQRHHRLYKKGVSMDGCSIGADHISSEHPEMTFSVRFWPDPEIFGATEFDYEMVRAQLRQLAATRPELEIGVSHEIWTRPFGHFTPVKMPDGMASMLEVLTKEADVSHVPCLDEPVRLQVRSGEHALDVAIQWVWELENGQDENLMAWANMRRSPEGSHVLGLREAVRACGLDDVPHYAALSVTVPEPRFTNACKNCLRSPEIRRLIRDHLTPALRRLAEDDEFGLHLDYMRERRQEEDYVQARKRDWDDDPVDG